MSKGPLYHHSSPTVQNRGIEKLSHNRDVSINRELTETQSEYANQWEARQRGKILQQTEREREEKADWKRVDKTLERPETGKKPYDSA